MPTLTNAKHERFAQEVAKGASNRDAYAAAGYAVTNEAATDASASRLLSDAKVQARVSEIQERAAARTEVTVAGITEKLLALAVKAEATSEPAAVQAARACYMDAAKLNGLVIDKVKAETVNRTALISDRPISEDEWQAEVAQHLN